MTDTVQGLADQTVYVLMIVDRSGSMIPRANDVRGGFNSYIEELAKDDATDYRVSLTLFDHSITHTFADRPLYVVEDECTVWDLPKLDEKTYIPSGMTALYDAVGESLRLLKGRIGTPEHPYGEARVLVVIITDGEENASSSYHAEHIRTMIKHREEAGNYSFVYLGADLDAWANSQALGISMQSSISFSGTDMRGMFQQLAQSTTAYSHSGRASTTDFGALYHSTPGISVQGIQTSTGTRVLVSDVPEPDAE